jgi:proteasome lid subunit RPN8/RPN11
MDASLDRLTISAHALLKVQEYARVVAERFGPAECAGFLLSDRASCVIDDVMLAPGQEVGGTSVTVSATAVLAAGREIEKAGRQVRGWWHSHGAHPVFHSQTDDETTEDVLNQIAATSELCEEEELLPSLAPNGGMVFERGAFAFSLVVNASGEAPHAELFLLRPGSDDLVRRVVPIEVASGLDRARIEQDVEERVVLAKRRRSREGAGEV